MKKTFQTVIFSLICLVCITYTSTLVAQQDDGFMMVISGVFVLALFGFFMLGSVIIWGKDIKNDN